MYKTLAQPQPKLSKDFFSRHVTLVAQDLLGKTLVFAGTKGIITETEAYRGSDDAASHAFAKATARSSIMFGEPGKAYVYLIYGMYHCLNVVTEPLGDPSAVLIRGLTLVNTDAQTMTHLNGPGRICKHLGITKQHNAICLISNPDFYFTEGIKIHNYLTTPRIGISKATDKLWRFVTKL